MATVAAKINIATWFEIPVMNLERAVKFYPGCNNEHPAVSFRDMMYLSDDPV